MLLPLLVLASAAALLGYAARSALWPAVEVWVVPVVTRPTDSAVSASTGDAQAPREDGTAPIISQAPGWIEADPFAISVPALTEGVIEEVLVLEGEEVQAGQVVARMVDDDARLDAKRAEAELNERRADVERSKAAFDAALARAEELRDEVQRKRELVAAGGISEGQFARLEIRLQGMEREADSAGAEVEVAQAAVQTHQVICEQARLMLERTEIRSPAAGVVMARLIEPGSRISMSSKPGEAAGGMAGAVMRLYDPAKIQVRVDVPLADIAKISVGAPAEIVTETLPDKTFAGTVTRIVHEANVQRNTVQVKVSIAQPLPELKPEMLARVRFRGTRIADGDGELELGRADSGLRLLVPARALLDLKDDKAGVWLIDQSSSRLGAIAIRREVTIARGSHMAADGYAEVAGGLHEGDRLVIDPPANLKSNSRVRILGERAEAGTALDGGN